MPVDMTRVAWIKGVACREEEGRVVTAKRVRASEGGGGGRTIAALADITGTTNYPVAGGTIPPGCTSSEARMERYDADVSPGMTREIPGGEFCVDKEGHPLSAAES